MVRGLTLGLLLCAVLLPNSWAESNVVFSVQPEVGQSFGHSTYEMDLEFIVSDVPYTNVYVLRSELEFPLDVTMVGGSLGLASRSREVYAWSVTARFLTSVNDPGNLMKDSDWATLRSPTPEQFSFTESDAAMDSYRLHLEGTVRAMHRPRFDLDIWGGLRYQRIEQDIVGYDGWFLDSNLVRQPISGVERAIFYRITFITPHLGAKALIRLNESATVGVHSAFALLFGSDFDDHLLRFKTAEADFNGYGGIFGASFMYRPATSSATRPFVEMIFDLTSVTGSGDQTQRWYGDDPASPDDDTGMGIPGIPHDIRSTQGHIGLRLGLAF